MGHGTSRPGPGALDAGTVSDLAQTLHALGTPSRLGLLLRLRQGPCTVGELAEAVDMEQSAVSHQLRILRHLRLIVGERDGRRVRYRLFDDHVAALLDQATHHLEHLRLGAVDGRAATPEADDALTGAHGP
jgi:ArsR family transcriptional regulator, nickel/cobalt-responsive transcriptional repressor